MLRNDLLRNYLTDDIEDCQLLRCRFSSQRQNDERKEGLLDTKVRGAHGCRDINKGEEREEGLAKFGQVLLGQSIWDCAV